MPRALILGLGRFGGGREAARFLARHGHRLRIHDQAPPETLAESLAALQELPELELRLGPPDPGVLDGADLMVVNPAIPDAHPVLAAARARGLRITQEVDLLLDAFPGRAILVTGTNGKSTTTTLLQRMLAAAGFDALAGGNLGHSLLAEEARWHRDAIAVVEISSFQLERLAPARAVTGAVLTRVTRDHLDRHGTLAAYQAIKGIAAACAREFVVHAADDPVARGFATAAARWTYGSGPAHQRHVGADGDWILLPDSRPLLHRRALHLLGGYDVENVQAAAAAALALGAAPHPIATAAVSCRPLPFRLQLRTILRGVRIYDNAISTDVLSTLVAAESLGEPVHWVGGGKSKDGDYARVASLLRPHLASAHLFGTAAAPLARALGGEIPVTAHDDLAGALAAAYAAARPPQAILFSPAFASFDQFQNFRARGLAFHRAADRLAVAAGGLGDPAPATEELDSGARAAFRSS